MFKKRERLSDELVDVYKVCGFQVLEEDLQIEIGSLFLSGGWYEHYLVWENKQLMHIELDFGRQYGNQQLVNTNRGKFQLSFVLNSSTESVKDLKYKTQRKKLSEVIFNSKEEMISELKKKAQEMPLQSMFVQGGLVFLPHLLQEIEKQIEQEQFSKDKAIEEMKKAFKVNNLGELELELFEWEIMSHQRGNKYIRIEKKSRYLERKIKIKSISNR